MCLESTKLHDFKEWLSTTSKRFESFQNKHLKFLLKHFAENGKEKLFFADVPPWTF